MSSCTFMSVWWVCITQLTAYSSSFDVKIDSQLPPILPRSMYRFLLNLRLPFPAYCSTESCRLCFWLNSFWFCLKVMTPQRSLSTYTHRLESYVPPQTLATNPSKKMGRIWTYSFLMRTWHSSGSPKALKRLRRTSCVTLLGSLWMHSTWHLSWNPSGI